MRSQLQKFTAFANSLLPHETEYLLSIQQFKDAERLAILKRVDFNAHHIEQFTPYDTTTDKRKYNHLQNWIKGRLHAVDVDEQFNWMLSMEQKIMTDTIRPEEEKELLKTIRRYKHPFFSFSKFYEVVQHYRHFLLVRLRYVDHDAANTFLKKYKRAYEESKKIHEKMHDATMDIVGQYTGEEGIGSKQWEHWLSQIFFNEKVEGHLRYLALVRLVFIAHNYRKYDALREKFDFLDQYFSKGRYYSKRLLLNYYNNRLMLHSNFREYGKAVHYGHLSIRSQNHDYLFYVNNLCAVLLRMKKNQDALQLMQKAAAEAKKTKNFHSRVGYVAFYMEALNENGLYKNAISYGDSFLRAYSKEILQYRWHLFFSVYLEALMHQGLCEKLLRIAQKHRLMERDTSYRTNAGYLPVVPFYIMTARYLEGMVKRADLIHTFDQYLKKQGAGKEINHALQKLMVKFDRWVPGLSSRLIH
ncbi:MAG: hypothetical protein AAFZ15_25345 [Bacteroidota bacterium]